MKARLAVDALIAVARRAVDGVEVPAASCIPTAGRRSRKFRAALDRHDLVGSMGQVGAAGDHAATESFFAPRDVRARSRQGLLVVAGRIVVGLAGAVAAIRVLANVLGIQRVGDPLVFASTTALRHE